jgi:hypothetical protein
MRADDVERCLAGAIASGQNYNDRMVAAQRLLKPKHSQPQQLHIHIFRHLKGIPNGNR